MTSPDSEIILSDNQHKQSILSAHEDYTKTLLTESQRVDKPMPKTPFFAAMFAMMASAMGTGIFNLPMRITEIGIIMFIFYVLVAGMFSYLGCILLQSMIVTKGFNEYGKICQTAFGSWLKRLLQFCIILFPWGITVCYQVIMPKFIIQLLSDVFGANLYDDRDMEIYNSRGNWLRVGLNVGIICTDFLLIQLKDISKIQKLSVIGVCSVIYNAVTIFILLLTGFVHKGNETTADIDYPGIFHLDWSIIQWFIFDNKAFSVHCQALASILFCYINHQLVFPTCKNMQNPTNQRLTACFFRSNLYQLIIYILIGLSGYILLIPHQDILPISPMVLTSINTWPMTIGKTLMIITLYLAVPLNLFPARTILNQALNLQDNNKNHYILSIALAASSCIVAISFVKVNSYFGLLGGTAGVLMGCSIPALCYWKLIMKTDPSKQTILNYSMLVFTVIITIVGFIGAILSVADPV